MAGTLDREKINGQKKISREKITGKTATTKYFFTSALRCPLMYAERVRLAGLFFLKRIHSSSRTHQSTLKAISLSIGKENFRIRTQASLILTSERIQHASLIRATLPLATFPAQINKSITVACMECMPYSIDLFRSSSDVFGYAFK